MPDFVTPEALKEMGVLHKKVVETCALVCQAAADSKAGKIDGKEWGERIKRHTAAAQELDLWRSKYINRLGT